MVALSALRRFLEYSISGPFMKVVSALSALLHPGDHALARRALLPFSDSSSKINASDGHLLTSPEKNGVLEQKCHREKGG